MLFRILLDRFVLVELAVVVLLVGFAAVIESIVVEPVEFIEVVEFISVAVPAEPSYPTSFLTTGVVFLVLFGLLRFFSLLTSVLLTLSSDSVLTYVFRNTSVSIAATSAFFRSTTFQLPVVFLAVHSYF